MAPSPVATRADTPSVAVVTLGCARNDADSEELAGRLSSGGFQVVDDPEQATAVVVNTCGFIAAAKKDSIDTVLAAADLKGPDGPRAVVAVGCLAERYGRELASVLPEADAVLGFDDYPDVADRLRSVLAGTSGVAHAPRDRRLQLPIAPVDRATSSPAGGPAVVRQRIDSGPVAALKLASGCDRRCSFCAIPRFRGAYVSRPPAEVLAEARWLAGQGVRELYCVSENTTSYGKDRRDLHALSSLLPELASVEGVARVRLSYLQPAELRPDLVATIADVPGVAAYFDLSFQHASGPLLRRMRRFGDAERFLELLASVRAAAPLAGIRSNVIVGFPGETEPDVDVLCDFLAAAQLDAVGVFGYSDEDGTEAATLAGQQDDEEIAARVEVVSSLVDELVDARAARRCGEQVEVLVEKVSGSPEGRAEHQGPDGDGTTRLVAAGRGVRIGDIVRATVTASEGADLVARPTDEHFRLGGR